MKKWDLLNKKSSLRQTQDKKIKSKKLDTDKLVRILLKNRGIKTKKEAQEFLSLKLESLDINKLGIDKKDLNKTLKRIKTAIEKKEQIIIFGDYDADGICGTAILWETLHSLGANVLPYIPNRIEEGYGLSLAGISNLKNKISNIKLVITVDNGIVANDAVEFAKSLDIDVIITDHHVPSKTLPKAFAIVHSTKVCGAGVAWFLSQEIVRGPVSLHPRPTSSSASGRTAGARRGSPALTTPHPDHLDLVAIATVADLVPLVGPNRILVKFGLEELKNTKRVGLQALYDEARIERDNIDTYTIGHIVAPRLNAMGRLEEAMDSLRLICTRDKKRANVLAKKLGEINRVRQRLTIDTFIHARERANKNTLKKLLFVYHESYEQGVIGLVAGRLTEEYYLPSIVLSKGEKFSKASARSVSGLNIIEFIREAGEFLVDAGGHPMAAGFTIETTKIPLLEKKFEELSRRLISDDHLVRRLKIDCELPVSYLTLELFDSISKLEPFGMKNPTPVFLSKGLEITDMRLVGIDAKHLKLKIKDQISNLTIDGIIFNYDSSIGLKIGDKVDVVYSIEMNEWNGNKKLELKIKDIKSS
ncbi:MAG: single-stranded-DNA-specific exonuclease RecJ [Candidatus Levybacteria bacterium]|nr:single-stranded-DNA-specific exonuclease RecJ [Candidatus Levybacteria bacterium]